MTRAVTITLPLPPRELSPNYTVGSRGGRLGKAAKIKAYRQNAMMVARSIRPAHPYVRASVQCVFIFKDKRRRDTDNLLASMKPAFDGLADAELVKNDREFTYLPVQQFVDKDNPRVVVTVTELLPDTIIKPKPVPEVKP